MGVTFEGGTIVPAVAVEITDNGVVRGGDASGNEQEAGTRDCEDSATRAPGAHSLDYRASAVPSRGRTGFPGCSNSVAPADTFERTASSTGVMARS